MLCEAALFASYHVNICIGSSAGDLLVWTFGNVALSRGSSSSCGTRGKVMGHPQFHGRVDRGLVGDALAESMALALLVGGIHRSSS